MNTFGPTVQCKNWNSTGYTFPQAFASAHISDRYPEYSVYCFLDCYHLLGIPELVFGPHKNVIMMSVLYWNLLFFSLNIMYLSFMHSHVRNIHFHGCVIIHCLNRPQFIHFGVGCFQCFNVTTTLRHISWCACAREPLGGKHWTPGMWMNVRLYMMTTPR